MNDALPRSLVKKSSVVALFEPSRPPTIYSLKDKSFRCFVMNDALPRSLVKKIISVIVATLSVRYSHSLTPE